MTKFKAYIRTITEEETELKVNVGIYDDDIAAQDRTEETFILKIPLNQPDSYVRSKVQEVLDRYKSRKTDLSNKQSLINETFS